MPKAFRVWAVAGRGLELVAHAIVAEARRAGYTELRFCTLRQGLPRLLAAWRPIPVGRDEWRVALNVVPGQKRP